MFQADYNFWPFEHPGYEAKKIKKIQWQTPDHRKFSMDTYVEGNQIKNNCLVRNFYNKLKFPALFSGRNRREKSSQSSCSYCDFPQAATGNETLERLGSARFFDKSNFLPLFYKPFLHKEKLGNFLSIKKLCRSKSF